MDQNAASPLDLDYVSRLARLNLSPEEKENFSRQLGDILQHFSRINAVDVSGVEPTAHAFPLENVLREDKAVPGFTPEEAMGNAPRSRENMIEVPPVIES